MQPIPWQPTPLPPLIPRAEAVELPFDDGWRQWHLAQQLADAGRAPAAPLP